MALWSNVLTKRGDNDVDIDVDDDDIDVDDDDDDGGGGGHECRRGSRTLPINHLGQDHF